MRTHRPQRLSEEARALGQVLRGLPYFRVLHETYGLVEVTDRGGRTWNYYDLVVLYENLGDLLSQRQYQALVLGYVFDYSELEVAAFMGLNPRNPVMMYASHGLNRLTGWRAA